MNVSGKSQSRRKTLLPRPCAFLWDESFLWGLMSWRALQGAGLPLEIISSEDIKQGKLSSYEMIYVPGGWAANKQAALGEEGKGEIRRFVQNGGSYLGICGGAGLATEEGLKLLPIRRKAQDERVPSFSGPVSLVLTKHDMWQGIVVPHFFAWWPSQFVIETDAVNVLARYNEAQPGAFSSDIPIMSGRVIGWSGLERQYGIYLNPERLYHEPAVVEGFCGRGKVVLSLIHFDTPGSVHGAIVLKNIWRYLTRSGFINPDKGQVETKGPENIVYQESVFDPIISDIQKTVTELIATGVNNFLWHWRTPMLLAWRRGVRGLEYTTLSVMIGEIARLLRHIEADGRRLGADSYRECDNRNIEEYLLRIRDGLNSFACRAQDLLIRERFYLMRKPLSPIACDDPQIEELRNQLFGPAMSHGGLFRVLINNVDDLLCYLIKRTV